MKKYALIGIALGLALLLGAAVLFRISEATPAKKLPPGADFVLQSADGPVDSKAFRGKVLLVYFGYSNCPDVCPASLAAGGQALKSLTPEERSRVKLLMVSVDPERDSLQHLKEYTAFFHPAITGITGTTDEIAALTKAFGASYIKHPKKADGSYVVDHTVSTYVVDPEGKLVAVLDLGTPTDKIVSTIKKYL